MTIKINASQKDTGALLFHSGHLSAESSTFRLALSPAKHIVMGRETALYLFRNGDKTGELRRLLLTLNPDAPVVKKLVAALPVSPDAALGELSRFSSAKPDPASIDLYKNGDSRLIISNGANSYEFYCNDLRVRSLEPEVWSYPVGVFCPLSFDEVLGSKEKLFRLFTKADRLADNLHQDMWSILIARMLRGNERRLTDLLNSIPTEASSSSIRHALGLLCKKGYSSAIGYMNVVTSSSRHLSDFRREYTAFLEKLRIEGVEFDDGILLAGRWRSAFYFVSSLGKTSKFFISPLKFYSVWRKRDAAEIRAVIESTTHGYARSYDMDHVKAVLAKVKPEFLLLLDTKRD